MKLPKKRSTDVYIRYFCIKFRRFATWLQKYDEWFWKTFYGKDK